MINPAFNIDTLYNVLFPNTTQLVINITDGTDYGAHFFPGPGKVYSGYGKTESEAIGKAIWAWIDDITTPPVLYNLQSPIGNQP